MIVTWFPGRQRFIPDLRPSTLHAASIHSWHRRYLSRHSQAWYRGKKPDTWPVVYITNRQYKPMQRRNLWGLRRRYGGNSNPRG